jgi:mono/diheme cytochrome c family protein
MKMLRKLVLPLIAVFVIGFAVFWFLTIPQTVPASALTPYTPDLVKGKTFFQVGGCASCHAMPGEKDRTRLGGGLALKSPFGTFYPPNISSDVKDGIGAWTEAQFVTAMHNGTSPAGTHYYPSFPYTSYQRMTIEDLRDLFAFLKTLPAVPGRVREHDLPFPLTIRRFLGVWKALFLDGQPFKPDPSQSAEWNRGAYLVNGPGHCAECHSPRNLLGGIVAHQRFAGGPNPEGKGWVPNITQERLADWSVKEIAYLLETGMTRDGDSVGGSMTEVVHNTAQISDADRLAMATYIKSLPAVEGPPSPKK